MGKHLSKKRNLSLWVEKELVDFGKKYAKKHKQSLSRLFEAYLKDTWKVMLHEKSRNCFSYDRSRKKFRTI